MKTLETIIVSQSLPPQDIKYEEIRAILDYMYKGEVNVAQDHLPGLLKVAELLKVKGLVEEEREKLLNSGKVTNSSNVNNLSSSSDLFNDDSNGSPIKKQTVNGPSEKDSNGPSSSSSMPHLPRPFMPTPGSMGAPPFPQFPFLPGMFPGAAQVRNKKHKTKFSVNRIRCTITKHFMLSICCSI